MAELRQILLVKKPRILAAIGGKGDKSLLFFAGVTSTMNATFRDREFAPPGLEIERFKLAGINCYPDVRRVIPFRRSPWARAR